MACSVTGDFIFIGMYRDKKGTNNRKYNLDLGEMLACTKRVMEATNGLGKRYVIGDTKDFYF